MLPACCLSQAGPKLQPCRPAGTGKVGGQTSRKKEQGREQGRDGESRGAGGKWGGGGRRAEAAGGQQKHQQTAKSEGVEEAKEPGKTKET